MLPDKVAFVARAVGRTIGKLDKLLAIHNLDSSE